MRRIVVRGAKPWIPPWRGYLTLAIAGLALFAAASPASAETSHKLLFEIDGSDTPGGSPFALEGIYIDGSTGPNAGDLYVNDGAGDLDGAAGSKVVYRFSSSGTYECQITGTGSASTSPTECDTSSSGSPVAPFHSFLQYGDTDTETGKVYLRVGNTTQIFSPAGAYLSQIAESGALSFSRSTATLLIGRIEPDQQIVDEYDPTLGTLSEFAAGTPAGPFQGIMDVAVDNDPLSPSYGNVYVADWRGSAVDVFDAMGNFVRAITDISGKPIPEPEKLAVDNDTGDLYLLAKNPGSPLRFVYQFASNGAFLGRFFVGEAGDVAVSGATGRVYLQEGRNRVVRVYGPSEIIPTVTTVGASGVGPKAATLEGTVNPDGVQVTDCHFDYGTSTHYGQTAPCVPAAAVIGSDSSDHPVTADLAGLLKPGTTYHFRLEATNANGTNFGEDLTFSTTPPPTITAAKAINVTEASADLTARINPNGNATTYRIEWGPTTAYGNVTPVPDAPVGGGGVVAVPITRHITGLSAGTTYHWRVVATKVVDEIDIETVSPDHTFIFATNPSPLPDSRAYEQVTPVQKNGSQFDAGLIIPRPVIATGGNRVMLGTIQCFPGATSCTATREPEGSLWSLERAGSGWQASPISPPATLFGASSVKGAGIDPDTGTAIFSSGATTGKDQLVIHAPDGSYSVIGPVQAPTSSGFGPASFALTSDDRSYVVFEGKSANLDWPFDATQQGGFASSVLEYEGAGNTEPFLVGVEGGRGSTDLVSECGTSLEELSSDGRTVIFSAVGHIGQSSCPLAASAPAATQLLARLDESETVLLSGRSASECSSPSCQNSAPLPAQFKSASRDGSKVLFSSNQKLTDAASQGSGNLYLYDFDQPAGHELSAISAGDSSGEGPAVRGVMAFSEDGSHAYFVAGGDLGGGLDAQGEPPVPGGNNLYVYERDAAEPAGKVSFIATLPQSDVNYWAGFGSTPNVNPDGRFLVFASHGRLTPDDASESGAAQIFRYDAQSDELLRISIGENGFNDNGNAGAPSLCSSQATGCAADASLAPLVSKIDRGPTMSDDGSYIFFQSPAALTPGALDYEVWKPGPPPIYGQNVYEYHAGDVYLISDGRDLAAGHGEGPLVGTDSSGSNVFFKTFDPLVAGDTDNGQLDLYDARIGGGFPTPEAPVPCEGDACRGAATQPGPSQDARTPGFEGPGNVKPKAGKHKHKHHRKKHRHRKKHQHKRAAGKHRRAVR